MRIPLPPGDRCTFNGVSKRNTMASAHSTSGGGFERLPDCGAQTSRLKCFQSLPLALLGEIEPPRPIRPGLGPTLLQPHLTRTPSLICSSHTCLLVRLTCSPQGLCTCCSFCLECFLPPSYLRNFYSSLPQEILPGLLTTAIIVHALNDRFFYIVCSH